MYHEQDRDIVIALADRLLSIYKIQSWSFDKGYWGKENKQLLQTEIPQVIMPKLGKRNKAEEQEEWFGIKGKIKYIPLWKWLLQ